MAHASVLWWIKGISRHLKTQEMCNVVVLIEPYSLAFVPETEGMCNEAVRREAYTLGHVPEHFRTQNMCNEAVQADPYTLKFVPDPVKTQEMCYNAVRGDAFYLRYVPDYYVPDYSNNKKYDMMTMIITMMMNLVSGMIGIKNARPKKKNKRRTSTHCLASINVAGLVCS